MKNLRMQQEMTDRGRLEIRVNARIQARPVSGARVTVSYTGDPQNVIEELITDGDGRTETLDLATPPLEYSLEPNVNQPYSEYTVKVEAEGYEPVEVTGSELLSGPRTGRGRSVCGCDDPGPYVVRRISGENSGK